PPGDGRRHRAAGARQSRRARSGAKRQMRYPLKLTVNGVAAEVEIEAHRNLLSVLRGELGLSGTKEGCDDSECGACMVLIDSKPVNSCSFLALQAGGREVQTIEGLGSAGKLHPL